MPDRPLVLFGKPEDADKHKRKPGFQPSHIPSHARQIERLTPQFNELQSVLDRGALAIQETPDGIDPEYTLVLEAYGDLSSFHTAIRDLKKTYDEVELLFETEVEDVPPDEDFYIRKGLKNDKGLLTFKCFCVLTNHRALKEILSLWNKYKEDENYKFQTGKTGLKDLFKALKSVHLWGTEERFVDTGLREVWEENLADPDIQNVRCEIELSFRGSKNKREFAEKKIEDELGRIGGKLLTKSCIPEIGYHAILAEIPRNAAQEMILNHEISFLVYNEILFVNPTGQTAVIGSDESFDFEEDLQIPGTIKDEPILALFDGLPQAHHPILEKHLIIDDPDDYTPSYEIKDRQHGTAMASLIIWGELNNNSSAISRKIYVRPIMKPQPFLDGKTFECVPENILIVDKIHSAVKNLFEPEKGQPISTIKIINLSIGIKNRPFETFTSPLAKLLDWLSFKYNILFIVSAGNYNDDIDLEIPFSEFKEKEEYEKDEIIINAINNNARNHKLLSPAESMNSLTVGALFTDHSNYTQVGNEVMPCSDRLPGPYSAVGRGINHSIKPDLLIEGGRNVINEDFYNKNVAHWGITPRTRPPGILLARPVLPTTGTGVGYSYGTSNSAAILSHNAIECFDVLDEVFLSETGKSVQPEFSSLLLRAMLVHGAEWGQNALFIGRNLGMQTRGDYCDKIHRYIGYGIPDISKVKECTKNRITLIGFGELAKEKAHLFAIPLPFNFSSGKILRSLKVTLAYFTPIVATTKLYKQAQVWFTVDNYKDIVKNRSEASDKAVIRGTIQHERYWGDNIITWTRDDTLNVKVNCKENIDGLVSQIPYAIFISFEIAPEYGIDVYSNVLARIRARSKIGTQIRG